MSSEGEEEPVRRSRPKDRSDRIIQVATKLFSERGYRAVSIDDIGDAVGITGPAVYRHFQSKEALLQVVLERLIERHRVLFSDAVGDGETPEQRLKALTERTTGLKLDEVNFLRMARAEQRHLPRPAARAIQRKADSVGEAWVGTLVDLHPHLSAKEAEFMVEVGGGVSESFIYYQPQLSKRRMAGVLSRMLLAAFQFDPAGRSSQSPQDRRSEAPISSTLVDAPLRSSTRERILEHAVHMFRRHGFSGVGIGDVANAAGLTGPALYNHFRNKEGILFAALTRMNEQLAVSAGRSLAGTQSAGLALERLIDSYLDLMIEDPDLMALYWSQKYALSPDQRDPIARGERSYIDDWVGVLRHDRHGASDPEARAMIYGAIGLMNGYWQARTALPPDHCRSILRGMTFNALVHA